MNGRKLLYVIAGVEEAYIQEAEQFEVIAAEMKHEKKKLAQRMTAVGLVLMVCVAVFAVVRQFPRSSEPHLPDPGSRIAAEQGNTTGLPSDAPGDRSQQPANEEAPGAATDPTRQGEQTDNATKRPANPPQPTTGANTGPGADVTASVGEPVPTAQREPASQPTTAETPASTEKPTEPSTNNSDPGGKPGAVFTSVSVSYAEAREDFGHPIAACTSGDFTGYEVGVVSRNGDIHADGAICLSVTYGFTNGSIGLQDQDRMTGSVAHHTGDRYEYGGRTFYVQTHDESYLDYYYEIGYFPTEDSGIAYQAFFDEEADVYEIMDMIISLEI